MSTTASAIQTALLMLAREAFPKQMDVLTSRLLIAHYIANTDSATIDYQLGKKLRSLGYELVSKPKAQA
ncbi:hypothetical protein MTP16_17115 [Hymenobacter monticola]|uniref:Uncharacterized protein n=1 Tax=Hymenobacter monticola TaxID=1705399 RepID=A0ABY4B100_9BACT|nr:hypothetical protein [Hymenobacter monticola]UOE32843.1 hypothetical protein MTP16_17115 [Hymenobacter monticola]